MPFRTMREVGEYLGSVAVLTLVMIRWVEGYSNGHDA